MARIEDHIRQWKHNRDLLAIIPPTYPDWLATVTFYTALQAVDALRQAGYDVAGLVAIFTYGFDVAAENFKQANCPFATLSNYNALIKFAENNQYISDSDVDLLKDWRTNPAIWGQQL